MLQISRRSRWRLWRSSGLRIRREGANQVDLVVLHLILRLGAELESDEEIGYRLVHEIGQLEEPACRDPNLALLVFLHDLKAHTELSPDIRLGQAGELARQAQLAADMDVDRVRTMLFSRVPTVAWLCGCLPLFRHAPHPAQRQFERLEAS